MTERQVVGFTEPPRNIKLACALFIEASDIFGPRVNGNGPFAHQNLASMGVAGEHQIISAFLNQIEKLRPMAKQNVIGVCIETFLEQSKLARNIAFINAGISPFINAFARRIRSEERR